MSSKSLISGINLEYEDSSSHYNWELITSFNTNNARWVDVVLDYTNSDVNATYYISFLTNLTDDQLINSQPSGNSVLYLGASDLLKNVYENRGYENLYCVFGTILEYPISSFSPSWYITSIDDTLYYSTGEEMPANILAKSIQIFIDHSADNDALKSDIFIGIEFINNISLYRGGRATLCLSLHQTTKGLVVFDPSDAYDDMSTPSSESLIKISAPTTFYKYPELLREYIVPNRSYDIYQDTLNEVFEDKGPVNSYITDPLVVSGILTEAVTTPNPQKIIEMINGNTTYFDKFAQYVHVDDPSLKANEIRENTYVYDTKNAFYDDEQPINQLVITNPSTNITIHHFLYQFDTATNKYWLSYDVDDPASAQYGSDLPIGKYQPLFDPVTDIGKQIPLDIQHVVLRTYYPLTKQGYYVNL